MRSGDSLEREAGAQLPPKIPGLTVNRSFDLEQKFSRPQTLQWKDGRSIVGQEVPRAQLGPPTLEISSIKPIEEKESNPPVASEAPKWLKYSQMVLRFFAYFSEAVPNSREETWRIRSVQILYYLEDDTIQVLEIKKEDGMSHGSLVSRRRIPRKDVASFVEFTDLSVGCQIHLHGLLLTIVDADAFTRDFMEGQGLPQNAPVPIPMSPLEQYRAMRNRPSGLSRSDPESPTRFAETLLGRSPSTKKLQKFLDGDSRVLRYFALWDEVDGQSILRRKFKILYYLEDDTLEILEIEQGAGGRDSNRFARRGAAHKGTFHPRIGESESTEQARLATRDFCIGASVNVHGRDFFIFDADEFTKQWMMQYLGASSEDVKNIDISDPPPPSPPQLIMPHNGFGDPEDSEQNCRKLIPTPPKRRYRLNDDCSVLRFAAIFSANRPLSSLDASRNFIISVFLEDNTVSIYEHPLPDSGIDGGKFLERSRRTVVNQSDVWIGATISICGRLYQLTDADESTIKYMEQHTDVFPKADGNAALSLVRQNASLERLIELAQKSLTSFEDFYNAVLSEYPSMTKQEVLAAYRAIAS